MTVTQVGHNNLPIVTFGLGIGFFKFFYLILLVLALHGILASRGGLIQDLWVGASGR